MKSLAEKTGREKLNENQSDLRPKGRGCGAEFTLDWLGLFVGSMVFAKNQKIIT